MLRFRSSYLSRTPALGPDGVLPAAFDLLERGQALFRAVRHWTRPVRPRAGVTIGALLDLRRSKAELVAENALLRHQLAILSRKTRRPKLTAKDRFLTVLLARLLPNWRDALHIVKPGTVIGWHRRLFKLYWRRKSRSMRRCLPQGTTALIRRIALENRNWGAEKIRGELLKLGIRVSKRTIQRIMWTARFGKEPNAGQTWRNFINNHAKQIWSCDFLHARDLLFRSVFAFFIMDVHTRRIVHLLILSEEGMRRMISEYVRYHNEKRPHQGIRQHIPVEVGEGASVIAEPNRVFAYVEPAHRVDIGVISEPVLGGLHHHYHRLAA